MEDIYVLSFRTAYKNDPENVANRVTANLKIKREDVEVIYLTEESYQPKYSLEYKADRMYDNKYYQVFIKTFPEKLKQPSFSIDKVDYKWMTLEEMWKDDKIKKNNADVLTIFEKYIFS